MKYKIGDTLIVKKEYLNNSYYELGEYRQKFFNNRQRYKITGGRERASGGFGYRINVPGLHDGWFIREDYIEHPKMTIVITSKS